MDRFWAKVEKTDSCWLWKAAIRRKDDGYGAFWHEGRHVPAHHFSLLLAGVVVPEGKLVAHTCDNPRCVRPDHLFVTDQRGNMADKVRKGRQARAERNGNSKLTSVDVMKIRSQPDRRSEDLAKEFGVSRATIWKARSGRSFTEGLQPSH